MRILRLITHNHNKIVKCKTIIIISPEEKSNPQLSRLPLNALNSQISLLTAGYSVKVKNLYLKCSAILSSFSGNLLGGNGLKSLLSKYDITLSYVTSHQINHSTK